MFDKVSVDFQVWVSLRPSSQCYMSCYILNVRLAFPLVPCMLYVTQLLFQ